MAKLLHVGLDIGSTTVKIVVMDTNKEIIYKSYERHFSDTKNTVCKVLDNLLKTYDGSNFTIELTGSGSMSVSSWADIPFTQEVIACKTAVNEYIPQTDVAIELGGEDAKIIYFGSSVEQRMNGTCAGGTGAFLDQMASLLNTDTIGLNELAKSYTTIYPIASRCGVFAKTDIQPLLNEGANKSDIAASIFQAVVNQTISGLACGRPIKGNIAFLGGPLNYLSELRNRFIQTLNLNDKTAIIVQDAHLLVARGAALCGVKTKSINSNELKAKIEKLKNTQTFESNILPPLFETKNDYLDFVKRHSKDVVNKKDINQCSGPLYLGIDAGSTTSKLVLIDDEFNLVYSIYKSNEGSPLATVLDMMKTVYSQLPKNCYIASSGVTGYGESLIKTALNLDTNEIETIAHQTAAKQFIPNVDSVIDIGGQDMKYIRMKDNIIDSIMLNEACSSGCGSFLQTFATNLNISIEQFITSAIDAETPIDLGSRCTVFMNSKIKQAQKEGASVGDIAAGLSYSVVKNAIQKVMKIRDTKKLGQNIVVQGGTFLNDAVLRAFELTVGVNVIRPDIAGLMGAYGVALIAINYAKLNNIEKSSMLTLDEVNELEVKTSLTRCKLCENNCQLTINSFNNGKKYISGNRCERGAGGGAQKNDLPDLYKYKYDRLFEYKPLPIEKTTRGTIGIPRVLNMYENYPFWHTLFTELGFRVILSEKSSRKTYEKGIESMPSESVCYPAKLAHGHIMSLIEQGVTKIFYPCIPYENKEYKGAENHYNCPIVISYSEVIKNNVEDLRAKNIQFINPFLPLKINALADRFMELPEFKEYNISKKEYVKAIRKAQKEYHRFKRDIQLKGEETIKYLNEHNLKGIVLSGRPYHLDPEINHGINSMITGLGVSVLTEDSISHLTELKRPLRVVDQWMYHSRLYAASEVVSRNENLELVQLTSFGCGVDAITTDQVEEILASKSKLYTLIKIDEINNLGAIRIRIRSLISNMYHRDIVNPKNEEYIANKIVFTKQMKKTHTILCPQMAPIQFEFLEAAMQASGYNLKLLRHCDSHTVETGLKYVNNDACYPSLLVIGQLVEALESGEFDTNHTTVLISQTGGGCRATNYIGFLRKALIDAGFPDVPVLSFNVAGLEKMPGFKISISMIHKMIIGVAIGDLIARCNSRNRPYEIISGTCDKLTEKWINKGKEVTKRGKIKEYKQIVKDIIKDYDAIPISNVIKPKVGIVGEILIKYHPFGNNNLVRQLEAEGAEVISPDLMGFVKFMASHKITLNQYLKTKQVKKHFYKLAINIIDKYESIVKNELKNAKKQYAHISDIWYLANNVEKVLSTGNTTGEGWYLTAEMLEFIENGVPNVLCVQPFACLPNHVVGKGVIKRVKELYPSANIAAVDYDPGASEANQVNRVKLMLSIANDNLEKEFKKKGRVLSENAHITDKKEKIKR